MKQKKPKRGARIFIVSIIAGSLILVTGTNLVLINTDTLQRNNFKTDADVKTCTSAHSCEVGYDHGGKHYDATYMSAPQRYADGEHIRVTVYKNKPMKVYSTEVVPLGFALVVVTIGFTLLTFGSVRLYQHWRQEHLDESIEIDLTEEHE